MKWLGLDIGGANLKLADGEGYAELRAFSLWQEPKRLADALRTLLVSAPNSKHVAVTMTGELADCYATKAEGVTSIVAAVVQAADQRHVRFYREDGTFVTSKVATENSHRVAAINWLALAHFASRYTEQKPALLIDVGSTTTDLVAIVDGKPQPMAIADTERMICGELVYTGVERTPLCAMTAHVPYRGEQCPTASELFATSQDVYLTLGMVPENPSNPRTADGRGATRPAARDRLARSICADRESFTEEDARAVASAALQSQVARIGIAAGQVLRRMPSPPERILISGQGEFLASRVVERLRTSAAVVSLSEQLGLDVSCSAPAHALAVLAREGVSS